MDMETGLIKYVIGPAIVAIIGIFTPIFKYLHKYYTSKQDQKAKQSFIEGIADISMVYHIMRTLMTHVSSVNRVIVLKSHNGGGVPSPKSPVYITALHEVSLKSTIPMLEDVQSRPIDQFHADFILKPLAYTGECHVDRDTAEGFLKDIYEAYNHSWSRGIRLHMDAKGMTYLVISFETGKEKDLTPFEREKIEVAISRIDGILSKY